MTKPISQLKFADYNPREIGQVNFEKLKRSIGEFGFAEPIVINTHAGRENIIVAGHMRVRAASDLGITEVPVFEIDVDEQKEKLLNIALNNPNLRGDYDNQKLAELIVGLNIEDVDITLTGFDEGELSLILEDDAPVMGSGEKMYAIEFWFNEKDRDFIKAALRKYEGKSQGQRLLNLVAGRKYSEEPTPLSPRVPYKPKNGDSEGIVDGGGELA